MEMTDPKTTPAKGTLKLGPRRLLMRGQAMIVGGRTPDVEHILIAADRDVSLCIGIVLQTIFPRRFFDHPSSLSRET